MIDRLKKINILFLIMTGIGSSIAIVLAGSFGLAYSTSAGIITLLTIQNTKKETILIAFKRILAFVLAILIASIAFSVLGYTAIAFGGFAFLFIALCNVFGLKDGISMNAVLTTHFLIEKNMDYPLIMNEVYLLLIGMSIGIILNLLMPTNKAKIHREQISLEEEMKVTLQGMASNLRKKGACLVQNKNITEDSLPEEYILGEIETIDFTGLEFRLEELLRRAYENAGNTLLADTKYLVTYLEMRKLQVDVLKKIMSNIRRIPVMLRQSYPIADFIDHISISFHELNNVRGLLKDMEELYDFFRKESLPISREEFENRAILFQILSELEYFLQLKRNFILELDEKNIKSYWGT